MRRIGLDLGGSYLRGALFDSDDITATLAAHAATDGVQVRLAIGERRDPASLAEMIGHATRALEGETPVKAIGLGFAGMLDDGIVRNGPQFGWRDVDFAAAIAAVLPGRSIVLDNDVNAIAWGEFIAGAARGATDVLAVWLGTGIGGAVIANGALVRGARGAAGEIGHTKVRWDDDARVCACGRRGCIEAYAGGAQVIDRIRTGLRAAPTSLAAHLAGDPTTAHAGHVDQAARDGDDWALALWQDISRDLALAIGNAMALLSPERVLLGGGLWQRTPLLAEMVRAALPLATTLEAYDRATVVDGALGDAAGLVGAADLAQRASTHEP